MAIGDKEFLGKPISLELSIYLQNYASKDDRADVSRATGVGLSTLRNLVYRMASITAQNSIAVNELMKTAIKNCQDNRVELIRAEERLKKMIKQN